MGRPHVLLKTVSVHLERVELEHPFLLHHHPDKYIELKEFRNCLNDRIYLHLCLCVDILVEALG